MIYLNDNKIQLFSVILMVVLINYMTGCNTIESKDPPSPIKEITLSPYLTSTPTKENTKIVIPTPTPTFVSAPTPTPTPILYTIVKNDTLTSIAYQHGIKLTDLIAANPGIDPNFLTIGSSITIPITGSVIINITEPTPVPVELTTPNCYQNADGGQWCLSLVLNNQPYDVENVSARVDLFLLEEPYHVHQIAVTPLNILPSGESTILTTYFPSPLPDIDVSKITLISTLPVQEGSQRYLKLSADDVEIKLLVNKIQAEISGVISLSNENQSLDYIWIAALAFDKNGDPIGFRKWESNNPSQFDEYQPFKFIINSLGPPIDEVKILLEAKRHQIPP